MRAHHNPRRVAARVSAIAAATVVIAGSLLLSTADPVAATVPVEAQKDQTVEVRVDCHVDGTYIGTNRGSPDYGEDAFTHTSPLSQAKKFAASTDLGSRIPGPLDAVVYPGPSGKTVIIEFTDPEGIPRAALQYYGDDELGWQLVHVTNC